MRSYLLFDLDGTVSDPKEGITKSLLHALQHFDLTCHHPDSLAKYIGPPLLDSFKELLGGEEEKAEEAVAKYREYYAPYGIYENNLYPGIAALLQLCRQQGKKIFLATSKPEPFARQILEHWGIDVYFDYIGGSELSGERVAKQEVIAYLLQSCGIKPEEALMIGDRRHDIQGAHQNNLPCVGVLFGYGSHEELTAAGADYLVSSVAELQQLLLGSAIYQPREHPLGEVIQRMIAHEGQQTRRIAHALKMHGYALGIAAGEGITGREMQLLQAAAILHDVGIGEAQRRFGEVNAKLQEQQGAILAGRFLRQLGWDEALIEEVVFLVGNHHSYQVDGGLLLQIIFDADYIVNYQERLERQPEGNHPSPQEMLQRFFTVSGKALFKEMI